MKKRLATVRECATAFEVSDAVVLSAIRKSVSCYTHKGRKLVCVDELISHLSKTTDRDEYYRDCTPQQEQEIFSRVAESIGTKNPLVYAEILDKEFPLKLKAKPNLNKISVGDLWEVKRCKCCGNSTLTKM